MHGNGLLAKGGGLTHMVSGVGRGEEGGVFGSCGRVIAGG